MTTTTNIVKWGNSRGVRLSRRLLADADLADNDAVDIVVENNSIIITKASGKKHRTLKERLATYSGEYVFEEWDTGFAVGEEIINDGDYADEL